MKQTNRILALLVALVLAFSFVLPAFAESEISDPFVAQSEETEDESGESDVTIWEAIKNTLWDLFVMPLAISAILPALLSIMIPPFIVFFPFIFIVIFIPVFLINIIF